MKLCSKRACFSGSQDIYLKSQSLEGGVSEIKDTWISCQDRDHKYIAFILVLCSLSLNVIAELEAFPSLAVKARSPRSPDPAQCASRTITIETLELTSSLVVASLFASELAAGERVAKAASAPADPLVTSSSAAYPTLHRPAGIIRKPPLLYHVSVTGDAWELFGVPRHSTLHLATSSGKP